MPGYKVHDATGDPEKMGNLSYRKGLNAPDYFKGGYIRTHKDYINYFEGCEFNEIISYDEFSEISKNPHLMDNPHETRNPSIIRFVNLPYVDLQNPFWQGYLVHLVGDKMFYGSEKYMNFTKFEADIANIQKKEEAFRLLHNDWDVTNAIVEEEFHIPLLPEIEDLGIVGYMRGDTAYINANSIIDFIREVRKITKNMDINAIEQYFAGFISKEELAR